MLRVLLLLLSRTLYMRCRQAAQCNAESCSVLHSY